MIHHSETDRPAPQDAPEDVNGTTKQPRIPLERTSKKAVRVILSNVLRVLEQHPAWHKALGYDELLNDVVFLARPLYLSDTGPWTRRPVTEQDYRETANWLQRHYQLYVNHVLAGDGLTTYAYRFPFHPIRTYLAGLTWDGTARLDTWLAMYCHVGLTPYTRAVASKTLIAAVARVYEPGCKVDTMTILEGEQGTYKSTVWNTLASDAWFTDWLPDLHDKDAPQTLCGKWFVELGELSQFQRSEVETVKRFVSAKQDHYRPAYGRKAATFPRQNIFVGSTNEAHYFKDSTGNRRFWPVKMEGEADIAGLVRDRDQLWAEAVIRYRDEAIWYLTGELATAAVQEQAERVELDDWEAVVLTYAEAHATPTDRQKVYDATTPTLRFITTADILEHAFKLENPLHWSPANTKRLGGILRRNGWKARPVWNEENTKQFKAFAKIHPVQPLMHVTGNIEEKEPIGNSECTSNNAIVTDVTDVTPLPRIYRDNTSSALQGICGNTGNTGNIGNIGNHDCKEKPSVGAGRVNDTHDTHPAPDSERPKGVRGEERPGPEVDLNACEEAATASANSPLDGQQETDRQTPTMVSRIGSQVSAGSAPPCVVCGHTERWDDHSVSRCTKCWPQKGR